MSAPIIHVHAVVFTLWLLTPTSQTGLVSVKKVQLHRKLGLWGFGLVALRLMIGLMGRSTKCLRAGHGASGWTHPSLLTLFR